MRRVRESGWNIDELKERMKRFGLAIIRLVEKMPARQSGSCRVQPNGARGDIGGSQLPLRVSGSFEG